MKVGTESKRFLAPGTRTLNTGDAFFELSQEFNDLIARRAYELFELRGSVHGHDREDWLQALSEISRDVPVEITETPTGFTIRADVPGFSEKEIEVRVAPRSVCITGKREETLEQNNEETVNVERSSRQIFRAVELPSEIDPRQVNATVGDGLLEINLLKVGLGKKIPVGAQAASA
jgi:HSP20 family molecular chaperone IbpA